MAAAGCLLAAVAVACASVALACSEQSLTYYVDAVHGSDENVGDADSPMRTVAHAVAVATAHDGTCNGTVVLRPGLHIEGEAVRVEAARGTASRVLSVRGTGPRQTTLYGSFEFVVPSEDDGGGGGGGAREFWLFVLSGFTQYPALSGASDRANNVRVDAPHSAGGYGATLRVRGVELHDAQRAAVNASGAVLVDMYDTRVTNSLVGVSMSGGRLSLGTTRIDTMGYAALVANASSVQLTDLTVDASLYGVMAYANAKVFLTNAYVNTTRSALTCTNTAAIDVGLGTVVAALPAAAASAAAAAAAAAAA
eukprot:CAMPEP_0198312438 /NCGR_PEP_ID=MMETSP1450-20131203/3796_1 /TAXON_ID=753684 ORGANISM="Madagascaria erythrocladiodes, Strain CCMP3234" /NCGR_SAMPLE_ID=MMETSP1450 /ASSEMBLY_ACC=CAM_ASM_001115 /LENGTH=308 /DNA_ID=CAMNT_0044015383 /DNA_START=39 /DNA_END=962 /DNA_ORIENTATION=-